MSPARVLGHHSIKTSILTIFVHSLNKHLTYINSFNPHNSPKGNYQYYSHFIYEEIKVQIGYLIAQSHLTSGRVRLNSRDLALESMLLPIIFYSLSVKGIVMEKGMKGVE